MTISAKIIADSVSEHGPRLTTLQLRYPRMIHSEFMTHRVFSRNASSSRAIPVERMIKDIIDDTAMPIHWGKNQKGMQADEELDGVQRSQARAVWLSARNRAIEQAEKMIGIGIHKQIANRLLEPFAHINVLVSSTNWNNFFSLRDHKDAQPEFRELAIQIKEAMAASTPNVLQQGQWHLPYVTREENVFPWRSGEGQSMDAIKISVARCARVSYLTQEGKTPSIEEDLKLYDRLVGSEPLHASPAEHQATPDVFIPGHVGPYGEYRVDNWLSRSHHGNFRGWCQYRKTLPNENVPG